jgi:hypothetical protein
MTDNSAPADLLYGVPAIASFLGLPVKNTYYLIEKRRLPHFRIGKTVCARRSTIFFPRWTPPAPGASLLTLPPHSPT